MLGLNKTAGFGWIVLEKFLTSGTLPPSQLNTSPGVQGGEAYSAEATLSDEDVLSVRSLADADVGGVQLPAILLHFWPLMRFPATPLFYKHVYSAYYHTL
jgi:hypothetical protein